MSSGSEYQDDHQSRQSSPDKYSLPPSRPSSRLGSRLGSRPGSRLGSRFSSQTPFSPRKRPRSESIDPSHDRKRYLDGKYNDRYRILFNETVNSAASRFAPEDTFQHYTSQIGASKWTPEEKATFFAALERLGRDDTPGIARAVGTKSMPEVCQYLLLLQDAASKQGDARVTLQDVPAALELGVQCSDQLEVAGDALAWYQERYEAKQEQERYGKYWLVTSDLASQVEDAFKPSRPATMSSSPPAALKDDKNAVEDTEKVPDILQEFPEANLLCPEKFLTLSNDFFMNFPENGRFPWSHWSELTTEIATEPSIYRTAFNDFHNLAISVTKRLVHAAMIQATSRIRAQGWRVKKGVGAFVRARDVVTAIDILGMKRNGRDRWRGVARRCGIRVYEGRYGGTRKGKREIPWNELEQMLTFVDTSVDLSGTDTETAGLTSGGEDEDFKSRALRSGTPLPAFKSMPSESEDEDDSVKEQQNEAEEDGDSIIQSSTSSRQGSPTDEAPKAPEFEENTVEAFDQQARRQEEGQMWTILGVDPPDKEDPEHLGDEVEEPELKGSNKIITDPDDWRSWTEYHAEWEEFAAPVPTSSFLTNRKEDSPRLIMPSAELQGVGSGKETGRAKSKQIAETEIPIRSSRLYAALRERGSVSQGREGQNNLSDDDSNRPTQSIEGDNDDSRVIASVENTMDWDNRVASDGESL
ncbi:hypothetical protein BS50DRAFT_570837 [Corynespora cassiicola Philippines]|uniref:Myb-like domain-containing protein n=1 Tax=Corynespora cassiicola Philippines TaxID=1448308 RepID=A0A2T2P1C9_CORCC|nr:hypothetical protein BS50DRAFT_570837 [Corynespora cassiicola Philippines]